MKKELVTQPSIMPGRKGIALAVAGMISATVLGITESLASSVPALSFLSTPGFTEGITALSAFAGYWLTKEFKIPS